MSTGPSLTSGTPPNNGEDTDATCHTEIVAETLPGYSPELNPDEGVWGWTKNGRLANLAASNTLELGQKTQDEFAVLRDDRQLLNAFVQEADLCCAA